MPKAEAGAARTRAAAMPRGRGRCGARTGGGGTHGAVAGAARAWAAAMRGSGGCGAHSSGGDAKEQRRAYGPQQRQWPHTTCTRAVVMPRNVACARAVTICTRTAAIPRDSSGCDKHTSSSSANGCVARAASTGQQRPTGTTLARAAAAVAQRRLRRAPVRWRHRLRGADATSSSKRGVAGGGDPAEDGEGHPTKEAQTDSARRKQHCHKLGQRRARLAHTKSHDRYGVDPREVRHRSAVKKTTCPLGVSGVAAMALQCSYAQDKALSLDNLLGAAHAFGKPRPRKRRYTGFVRGSEYNGKDQSEETVQKSEESRVRGEGRERAGRVMGHVRVTLSRARLCLL
ncbi:hypothetical protein C8R47DRAFT_1082736 [Mycena vitilis]|nr:hypothetical protein C8R47DRAFT_1082736 [Mycena vitilis]